FAPENLRENASLFALANGFIGMRGNLEERIATGAESIQATLLNGVFESSPIVYGEGAYGYAKNHETICNVMDGKSLLLYAGDEALDLGRCDIHSHLRTLDMRRGVLRRSFLWHTKDGAELSVEMTRLVSLTHQQLAAVRADVRCLSGETRLRLVSELRPTEISEGDPNDPRNAAGKNRSLHTDRLEAQGDLLLMEQSTARSGFHIFCAVQNRCAAGGTGTVDGSAALWETEAELQAGEFLRFEKSICYTAERTGKQTMSAASPDEACRLCEEAPAFDTLLQEQEACLDAFWEQAGLSIEGDDVLLQGLRFNLFHLFQSAGRDGRRNISAKGLTGEGYEGHYFWDTEAYMFPVFLFTEPSIARKLLEYRYFILPQARERARVLGHAKGALFPWRTIGGEEVSAYFPAGTAQIHIDGDIANAVREYWQATQDLEFLAESGAEILVETARLYYSHGFFSEGKGGRFVLNCVTGPDEYNVLVNNNVYTNMVAEENFRSARAAMCLLKEKAPAAWARLCGALGYTEEEGAAWIEAADRMYYPAPRDGIIPQDDDFLDRQPWPLESIPAENRPLLIHYHGLQIYRAMVCKQADLILAMTVFGDRFTKEEKRKNFRFYDHVTTHDSSLSMAVFSILACEIGELDTAYRYFMSSARLDLEDIQGNTKDGLHMANMAGAWNGLVKGFGGMRCRDGALHFSPVCPEEWTSYSFRLGFRGRLIEVRVTRDGADYRLLRGEKLTVFSYGQAVTLLPEA
ncbi:MAG: glycoside hydrolase family 65 protein, partial [Oscillospiraceae bacterium]|nr:glycoside hydrolase family 65 protein [Oscillospiraceae bacterium]